MASPSASSSVCRKGYGQRLPNWMKVEGVGQLKATLAEVVIVVLIVIFARVVVGTVELSRPFEWPMLVLPASIFLIATALRMIELGGAKGSQSTGGADAGGRH
ncbi:MAG TPA: YqhA family protein [Methyloceanibacter sp.]|nr:YqhA family protein [Methyloceanibacter sp.]